MIADWGSEERWHCCHSIFTMYSCSSLVEARHTWATVVAVTIPPEMLQTGRMREPSLVFKNTSSWLQSLTERKTLSPKMHYFVAGLEYNYGIHMIIRLSLTPSIVSISTCMVSILVLGHIHQYWCNVQLCFFHTAIMCSAVVKFLSHTIICIVIIDGGLCRPVERRQSNVSGSESTTGKCASAMVYRVYNCGCD